MSEQSASSLEGSPCVDSSPAHLVLIAFTDSKHTALLNEWFLRAGHQVIAVNDGREALEKIVSEKPDLVVLDTALPSLDGFEVMRTVKAVPALSYIPSILCKVDEESTFDEFCKKCFIGVDCLLCGPINPLELVTFTRRIFDSLDPEYYPRLSR